MERCVDPNYRTAFYSAVDHALSCPAWATKGSSRWIVSLTDGADNCSSISVPELKYKLSQAHDTHLIIVGLQLPVNLRRVMEVKETRAGTPCLPR